jgi:hypothetical protein
MADIPATDDSGELICRPYITLKNGRRLYAAHYGKSAFCWRAKEKKSSSKDDG